MSEADENDRDREGPPPKKPYTTPRLIEYGRAADLTGSGTGSQSENNPPHGPGSKKS